LVRFLADNGADLNLQDNNGNTPLNCAAQKGFAEVARILVEAGAQVNTVNKFGDTPLIWF